MVDSLPSVSDAKTPSLGKRKLEAGGIIELTVKKAELTGESLLEFTQSFVNVKF